MEKTNGHTRETEYENLFEAESESEAEFEQMLEQALGPSLHETGVGTTRRTSRICYVTVTGSKQGKFKGSSLQKGQEGKIEGLRFTFEVTSPRDVATGQVSGKRQYKPIGLIKPIDASSPQFFQALITNEVLPTVLFEFHNVSKMGTEQTYYTIKLTNATVAKLGQSTPTLYSEVSRSSAGEPELLEEIWFSFQKIEMEHKLGKTRRWINGKVCDHNAIRGVKDQ